jgi:hexosaminidase
VFRHAFLLVAFALPFYLTAGPHPDSASAQAIQLVPAPTELEIFPDQIGIRLSDELQYQSQPNQTFIASHVQTITEPLFRLSGHRLKPAKTSDSAQLELKIDATLDPESYSLSIKDDKISIVAADPKGLCHATASLFQIIGQREDQPIPAMRIVDQPSCRYRSLMVDLGRNPHRLECLKETVDLLWFYKMDSLHLHLTDDQRFAFPSKAFPKLATEQGLITWEQFAALETYANMKGITLIPELDVPGHSTILRREYPKVFGESTTDLATNQASRDAVKTLLDEMIELFPSSPFIHIGGDEAYGVDENIQREFINEMHAHLKSKGKQTVVWEGPSRGEGELAVNQDVIHINWRTINFPADQMLKAGHSVVNAAWDPLYVVDHYPRNNFTMASPEHIYQRLDLARFAHFNPEIPTFKNPIVVKPNDQLIGFCMPWWEGREINFFPLVTPRVIPLADVAWNGKHERDFDDFASRTVATEAVRVASFFPVSISAKQLALETESVFHEATQVELVSKVEGRIRYTTDGSTPTASSPIFESGLKIQETTVIRAAVFVDGNQVGHGSRRTFVGVQPVKNLALGMQVTSSATSGPLHSPARITDGDTNPLAYYLGYPAEPDPIEITIDLKAATSINRIVTHTAFNGNSFESYTIAISADGENFVQVADRREKPEELAATATHEFATTKARYIRIKTNGRKNMVFDAFSKFTEIQAFLD